MIVRSLSSTAFRVNVPTPETKVNLDHSKTKIYFKIAENGRRRAQVFCPECAAQLFITSDAVIGSGRILNLRAGCILEREQLVPQRQIWCRSAHGKTGSNREKREGVINGLISVAICWVDKRRNDDKKAI